MVTKSRIAAVVSASLCAALILVAFGAAGSDTYPVALSLMSLASFLCFLAWLGPLPSSPPVTRRKAVFLLTGACFLFAIYIGVQSALLLPDHGVNGQTEPFDPSSAIAERLKLGGIACAFAFAMRVAMTDDGAKRLLDVIIFSGGVWAVVAIIMHILDPDGIYGIQKIAGAGRLTGAFSSPNSAGTLFGALSVLALGRFIAKFWRLSNRRLVSRLDPALAAVWVVSLAALSLTLSRTGIASTAIASAFVFLILCWRKVPIMWLLPLMFIGAIVVAALFWSPLTALIKRARIGDSDAHGRAVILIEHMKIAAKKPLFGWGPGSFRSINNSLVNKGNFRELAPVQSMHNVYIQWFEEYGAIGMILLLVINTAILIPMASAALKRPSLTGRLVTIICAYSVFLLHGLTDYAFQEPALQLFTAILLGTGFAAATNASRASSSSSSGNGDAVQRVA